MFFQRSVEMFSPSTKMLLYAHPFKVLKRCTPFPATLLAELQSCLQRCWVRDHVFFVPPPLQRYPNGRMIAYLALKEQGDVPENIESIVQKEDWSVFVNTKPVGWTRKVLKRAVEDSQFIADCFDKKEVVGNATAFRGKSKWFGRYGSQSVLAHDNQIPFQAWCFDFKTLKWLDSPVLETPYAPFPHGLETMIISGSDLRRICMPKNAFPKLKQLEIRYASSSLHWMGEIPETLQSIGFPVFSGKSKEINQWVLQCVQNLPNLTEMDLTLTNFTAINELMDIAPQLQKVHLSGTPIEKKWNRFFGNANVFKKYPNTHFYLISPNVQKALELASLDDFVSSAIALLLPLFEEEHEEVVLEDGSSIVLHSSFISLQRQYDYIHTKEKYDAFVHRKLKRHYKHSKRSFCSVFEQLSQQLSQ